VLSSIRNMLQFLWYNEGENIGNNEVCIVGILEYHVVLVNKAQIRSIKDVSHWVHAGSLYNACGINLDLLPLASVWC